jgi:hypothetical protein
MTLWLWSASSRMALLAYLSCMGLAPMTAVVSIFCSLVICPGNGIVTPKFILKINNKKLIRGNKALI